MGIEVYFVSSDPETTSSTLINEKRVLRTLGDRDQAVAVHLKELFESVTDAIVPSLQTTGDLVIELTGSLDVKLDGSIKYLIFNASAAGSASGSMKVTLKTQIAPKKTPG